MWQATQRSESLSFELIYQLVFAMSNSAGVVTTIAVSVPRNQPEYKMISSHRIVIPDMFSSPGTFKHDFPVLYQLLIIWHQNSTDWLIFKPSAWFCNGFRVCSVKESAAFSYTHHILLAIKIRQSFHEFSQWWKKSCRLVAEKKNWSLYNNDNNFFSG